MQNMDNQSDINNTEHTETPVMNSNNIKSIAASRRKSVK